MEGSFLGGYIDRRIIARQRVKMVSDKKKRVIMTHAHNYIDRWYMVPGRLAPDLQSPRLVRHHVPYLATGSRHRQNDK